MHAMSMARGRHSIRQAEKGYVLLALLLCMALLMIAVGTVASSLAFTIRRDREEELIHRGVQYTRAIREFTKKTGRFPLRLEELDNTEGRRFLRRHYKDPITGGDFKLVHMADVQIGGTPQIQGATPVAGNNPAADASNGVTSAQAAEASDTTSTSQPSSPAGQTDRSTPGAQTASSQQPISGGLIVGVVSASKKQTIREFNRKRHYNEWRFYYDTAFDRNFLVNAPTEKSYSQQMLAGTSPNGSPQGMAQPSQTDDRTQKGSQ